MNPFLLDDGQEPKRRPTGALNALLPVLDEVLADVEVVGKDRLGEMLSLGSGQHLVQQGSGPLQFQLDALGDSVSRREATRSNETGRDRSLLTTWRVRPLGDLSNASDRHMGDDGLNKLR